MPLLESKGYDYVWRPTHGDDGPPFYAWFIKRNPATGCRTHHLHMVEVHFAEHWDRLIFRDYLIERPDVAQQHRALKIHLAAAHTNDRIAYTRGKTEFIRAVMDNARRRHHSPPEGGHYAPRSSTND